MRFDRQEFESTSFDAGVQKSPVQVVGGNPALAHLSAARSVLMLQGPVGAFFDRLTRWLQMRGVACQRVAFHGGDVHDCGALVPIRFNDPLEKFAVFLMETVARYSIDTICLFGQARAHHVEAIRLAKAMGIQVLVFEEGYFRPGHVTVEIGGVNGYSTTLDKYRWAPGSALPGVRTFPPPTVDGQFGQMARYAMAHYWAMAQAKREFPHYLHHKDTSVLNHSFYWLNSWAKKAVRYHFDALRVQKLPGKPYFFVALQFDGDSQITHHSPFVVNSNFIARVMESFAQHAPKDVHLVFRQHPFSRGGIGHGPCIQEIARELGIASRVTYLVEGHTPTIVKNSLGVVLINSTVGLQALHYRRPLAVLGDALYKREGLAHMGDIDDFWKSFTPPDEVLCADFLDQLRHLTQAQCNVYGLPREPLLWQISGGAA